MLAQVSFGYKSQQANAGSYIALLREQQNEYKVLALQTLIGIVDTQWSEISEFIDNIEELYEDKTFQQRDLAAFLCSKVYYHLGDKDEALNYALEAGTYFNVDVRNQYTESLTWHCIDQYIANADNNFDPKKIQMVTKIIRSTCQQGNHLSAIGVCLDIKRFDLIQEILEQIKSAQRIIQVIELAQNLAKSDFKDSILKLCVDLIYEEAQQGRVANDDWGNFIAMLVQLGEVSKVAEILWSLIGEDSRRNITAYQIAIDLADIQRPQFMNQLIASLPVDTTKQKQRERLVNILSGELQRKSYQYFLKKYNQTDPSYLQNLKTGTDAKHSVPHGAALMSHGLFQMGTQDSQFLKNNLEWATSCNYWPRFNATASLGMIYKGSYEKSMEILGAYLPNNNNQASPFENGGALYGLGLINYGNRNNEIVQKMTDAIRSPQLNKNEQIIHGACLGLGLVQFATEDQNICELLKEVLFKNESIYGESAALGLGLLYAGSHQEDISQELLTFSNQTDKEKIIRSLGLAQAMIQFSQEDRAETVINTMLKDTEPFVRYGGVMTLAMAYIGTGSNKVIQRLLTIAVEDVADDVRRSAVIALAFVLFKNYEQVPKVMRLLILSYNPHIRYGTALALGISCAGTAFPEAINMLEPMLQDNVDFVRQGALISMALILMQSTTQSEPKLEQYKKTLSEMQSKKHETVLVKLGTYLAQGILDAGGRNVLVQMTSRQGIPKLDASIGMMLFTNYWYWFPSIPFIQLAMTPCALIGLNENLDIPKQFQIQNNAKQSMYGYPAHLKADEKKVTEKKTVKLSTTNRVKARQNKKEAERLGGGELSLKQGESQMSLEQQQSQNLGKSQSAVIEDNSMKVEEAPKKEEAPTCILNNPTRILEKQKKVINWVEGRYQPLFKDRKTGLIMLLDTQDENEDKDVISLADKPKFEGVAQPIQEEEPEVQAPEEFMFDENAQNESESLLKKE